MKAIRYIRNQLAKARLRVREYEDACKGKAATPGQQNAAAYFHTAVTHWEGMLERRNDTLARRKANREATK